MRKATRYARTSALPAIAAALALSSTTALAQEVQPTTTDAVPQATTPAPAPVEATPVTTDTPDATATAPTDVTPVTKPASSKPKHHATAQAAPAPRTVARTVTTRTTHASVPVTVAGPAAPAPVEPAAPAQNQSAVKPIVDMSAADKPAPAQTAVKPADNGNETAMEIGGGALALLALGAGAFALSRRRRHEDDEIIYDEAYEPETAEPVEAAPAAMAETAEMPRHDPVYREQANIVAPDLSAFSWGNRAPETVKADDDGSDRNAGETWVERAYRGPSPANPSASLKNRLRRAAFFDKRERDVAEGKAEPVETDAGLPDAMVEEQERELA